jgi:pyrroloquinoline quinone (PQQ) biosynthesis protein C
MVHPVTEWVRVAGETAIIAHESGEVWFNALDHREAEKAAAFAEPMTGRGTSVSTTGLLDGAISLAFEQTDKRFEQTDCQPAAQGPTLLRYIYALVGAYHTAKDTPRNLLWAAEHFEEIGRPEVTAYLEMRAREETGHERLALKDLRALGLPAERIVANLVPVGIKPLCDLFERFCFKDYPIECIGFSYCSERIAALKPKAEVDAIQSLFPEGVDAARFLRSHSSLGSEVSHVEETIEFVVGLPAEDRISVVQATYETALLMAEGRRLESSKSAAETREELEQAAGAALRRFEWPRHIREALARSVH